LIRIPVASRLWRGRRMRPVGTLGLRCSAGRSTLADLSGGQTRKKDIDDGA
jgi:hypothetical protein